MPATLYLLGCLVIISCWIKLALARRIFSFRQVFFLTLCGGLDFILAVIAVHKLENGASSSTLGGMASLVCLCHLLAICFFLPKQTSLPGFLDRILAATFTSSLVLDVLSSVHHWRGRSTVDLDGTYIIYAEATCLLVFYMACICASQFHRFFAIVDQDRELQIKTPPMAPLTSITFLASLLFLIGQSCIAYSLFRTPAAVITASTASALAYVLLVATFVLQNRFQEPKKAVEVVLTSPEKEVKEESKEEIDGQETTFDKTITPTQINTIPLPSSRSRSTSNIVASEAGSVIWIGHAAAASPRAEMSNRYASTSRPRRSTHIASGLSLVSWDRVQYLMNTKRSNHPRPTSGLTFYGSESSFPEGVQSQRSSILSSFGRAVTGYGSGQNNLSVPAIPHRRRHLSSASQIEIGFSPSLSPGEIPVPSSAPSSQEKQLEQKPESVKPGKHISLKDAITTFTCLFSPSIQKSHALEKESQGKASLSQKDSTCNLPSQYQSSKLFPTTEWQKNEVLETEVNSPNASEVKYTVHDNPVSSSFSPKDRAKASLGSRRNNTAPVEFPRSPES